MSESNREIFRQIKERSEKLWETVQIKSNISGFQIQAGTKWLPGISKAEIAQFEQVIGLKFPEIYRDYLAVMNGTDKPAKNIFAGRKDLEPTYAPSFYSYPRDLEVIKNRISWIYEEFGVNEESVRTKNIPHIMPIYGHRFLVLDNCPTNPVLSMWRTDVIIYGDDLVAYLAKEIGLDGFSDNGSNIIDPSLSFWFTEEPAIG